MAREALALVGLDPGAEEYWYAAINDPDLSAHERSDLIEDLNEDGPKKTKPGKEHLIAEISAAFQAAVVDVLVTKTIRAAKDTGMGLIVVSGGVASNTALREALKKMSDQEGIHLVIPERKYCTDNAAMIGIAGIRHFRDGHFAGLDMNAVSRWSSITG